MEAQIREKVKPFVHKNIAKEYQWSTVHNLAMLRTKPVIKNTNTGRIISVFLNVDLRCSHLGLSKVAEGRNINVNKIVPGNYIVFINTKKDKFKIFAANGVLAYYRSPRGRIDLNAIKEIPKAFNGSTNLNYDSALEAALTKYFQKRRIAKQTKK